MPTMVMDDVFFFMVMMRHLISGSDTRRGSMAGTWGIRPLSRVKDMVKNRVHGQTWVIVIIAMSPPSKSSSSTRIGQQVTTITVLKMINRSILDSLPSHSSSIKSQCIHQAVRHYISTVDFGFWFLVNANQFLQKS